MKVFVITPPGMYTYGAMVIAGIVRDAGYAVTLTRTLEAPAGETVFLSLYSTQNLMDEALKSFIAKYRETGGRVYVGGPVSAVPEMVLGELAPDAVICGEGEAGGTRPPAGRNLRISTGGDCLHGPGRHHLHRPGIALPGVPSAAFIPADIAMQDVRGGHQPISRHNGVVLVPAPSARCLASSGVISAPALWTRSSQRCRHSKMPVQHGSQSPAGPGPCMVMQTENSMTRPLPNSCGGWRRSWAEERLIPP